MFDWFKRYRLVLSVVATLIVLSMMVFRTGEPGGNSKIQSIVQTVTYPVQMVVHHLVDFTSNVISSYVFLVHLREENEVLKQQIVALQEEVDHYIEESIQYNRLKVQLEFAEKNPDKKIFAEVIGESVDNFHKVLHINRGSLHGIRVNFPVILKEGAVGRVQSVTPMQSSVLLILDRRSRFPAIVQRNRMKGMVYGTHDGLELRRINLRSEIKVGDRIVTSGLSGLFPKGRIVGVVKSLERQDYDLFQVAQLESVVDFDKIEGVFVILRNVTASEELLFSSQ